MSGRHAHLHRDVCRREDYFDTAGSLERLCQAVVKSQCAKCSNFKGLTADSRRVATRPYFAPLLSVAVCEPLENSSFGRLTFDSHSPDSHGPDERSS